MFIFKKAVSPFLLPPGIFVLILICSGFFFFRRSFRMGMLNIGTGLLIWLLSISPVTDRLMHGLEAGLKVPRNPQGDVIVMLGGGVSGGVPTADTFGRIVTTASLYRVLHVPIIVSGGGVYAWRKAEAPIDAQYLEDLGVPPEDILPEDKSRDTLENARYTKKICDAHHFTAPLLVTSAYHMKRSLLCFRHEKMHVTAVPADLETARPKYGWRDYLPLDLGPSVTCLHEYLGILYEKLFFKTEGVLKGLHAVENRLGLFMGRPAGHPGN